MFTSCNYDRRKKTEVLIMTVSDIHLVSASVDARRVHNP